MRIPVQDVIDGRCKRTRLSDGARFTAEGRRRKRDNRIQTKHEWQGCSSREITAGEPKARSGLSAHGIPPCKVRSLLPLVGTSNHGFLFQRYSIATEDAQCGFTLSQP